MSPSVAPSNTGVIAWKPSFAPAQPRCVSRIWPTFMRLGTPSGLSMIWIGVPSARWGMSSLGQDFGDHALVAVAAGHLVAHGNHPLGGNVDLDHLQHAAAELVAALHRVELAVAGVDGRFDRRPFLLVELLQRRFPLGAADVPLLDVLMHVAVLVDHLGHAAVVAAFHQRTAVVVGELLLQHLLNLGNQAAEGRGDPLVALGLGLLQASSRTPSAPPR